MLGMITTAAHKRIVAERDAEIADAKKLIQKLTKDRDLKQDAYRTMCRLIVGEQDQSRILRTRLAPFTTPRARNAKGQFMKDVV